MTMQTWEDGAVIARQGERDRAFGIIQVCVRVEGCRVNEHGLGSASIFVRKRD